MSEAIWMLHAKKADFNELARKFHISPVTARIIRNREIEPEEGFEQYLYGSLEQLYEPRLLPDMEKAVKLLQKEMEEGSRIRIVGDYDIDGVCATCILYRALKRLGASVDYVIPERIRDGYGINEHIIEEAHREGVQVLLTCDNGIAAISQIALAKELGMRVVVTDHHDIQKEDNGREKLPEADAILSARYAAHWWLISWCRCFTRRQG